MFGYTITYEKVPHDLELKKTLEQARHAIKVGIKNKKLPTDSKIHEFEHKNKKFLFVLEKEDNPEDIIQELKTR